MFKFLKTKRTKTIIALIFIIFLLTFFMSTVYSAFSSTINLSGVAHTRVESDVRITDFEITDATNNASSQYEEFSKNTLTSAISLPTSSSTITYKIEVTNYGSDKVSLINISGLPENLNYTLTDYKLKETICDESNKCTNLAIKTFYLTISYKEYNSEITNYNINLNFEFQTLLNITYVNNDGNYQKEILAGETLTIDFSSEELSPTEVNISGNTSEVISYQNKILKIENVKNDLQITLMYYIKEYNYNYTGNYQTFTAPNTGTYKIELWGAQGGSIAGTEISSSGAVLSARKVNAGGTGGYTNGIVSLEKNKNLYVYVGSTPSIVNEFAQSGTATGGYNGGGNIYSDQSPYGAPGGGATDIRLVAGTWSSFESLKSRIMVASGGGGANFRNQGYGNGAGGQGGGLEGNSGYVTNTSNATLRPDFANGYSIGMGGTQTSGGKRKIHHTNTSITYSDVSGEFGSADSTPIYIESVDVTQTGGGSGYYGGSHGIHAGGGGGSSFISGHEGCNAIAESSTQTAIIHTGQSIHYSGYKFTNTKMIDGAGYNWTTSKGSQTGMPTHDGLNTMTGNIGNGYAKITMIFNEIIKFPVVYEGISGNYPTQAVAGKPLTIDFLSEDVDGIYVYINGKVTDEYTYQNGILTIPNVYGDIKISTVYSKYEDNLLSYYPFTSNLQDMAPKKYYGDFVTQSSTTLSFSNDGVLINSVGLRTHSNLHLLIEPFTIIVDFKPVSLASNYHHIWGIWQGLNTATNYNSLSYNGTQLQIQNGSGQGIASNALTTNKWHKLIVTGNSTEWNLYVNGTSLTKLTSTFNKRVGYIYIGKNISNENVTSEPAINGYLKNLRIYNTMLSPDDIKQLSK